MGNGSGQANSTLDRNSGFSPAPTLLVELQPWPHAFLSNLADFLLRRPRASRAGYPTAPFWADVFVTQRLPWSRFIESFLYHCLAIELLWASSLFLPQRPQIVARRPFDSSSVIYFSATEYLLPLNTIIRKGQPTTGEPEYAKQPIISVPPESDNRTQTIVTPPNLKLSREVPVPNIVAWTPGNLPVPMAATRRSVAQLQMPELTVSVIAPAPEVRPALERQSTSLAPAVIAPAPQVDVNVARSVQAPKPAIIEPPPEVAATSGRRVGEINMGRTQVIAPAPQLPVAEQRAIVSRVQETFGGTAAAVVPPPPAIGTTETSPVSGRLIALGIHPAAIHHAIEMPAGNRRGTFAATPEGKPGAAGTPTVLANGIRDAASNGGGSDGAGGGGHGNGGAGTNPARDIPAGIFVGSGPQAPATTKSESASARSEQQHAVDRRLLAGLTAPRIGIPPRSATSVDEIHSTDVDKEVFGPRRFYSMTLNMPNLNSVGGSWVIRFAELNEDGGKGDLVAPLATQKVDPAYPAELMRRNVHGTVTLYAIIHSDGHVGEVRVLRGIDQRLDDFACAALLRWHFRPATKNGNAVALEAVVTIPFRSGEER
jgi:TonB family protein